MAMTGQATDKLAPPDARAFGGVGAVVSLAALYALTHPFAGFVGDAQIYMGRALADLDPQGVGRDLMFRLDGQSRFTIFPPIAAWLVAHTSLLAAAMILVAASSILWFLGVLALVRQAAPARLWACAAIVILAPAGYGGFNMLRVAEPFAVPRPFAEGFVLLAVAAFLGGRLAWSILLLGAAAIFHPIMAMAGIATLGLVLCVEDRRWLLAAASAALLAALAVAIDNSLSERLRTIVDPDWLGMLMDRNAYLFPHLWPATDYARPLVQAATIVIAAMRVDGRLRRVLIAALATGAIGLIIAWIVGRYDPVLLLMQAQFWRMWWLAAVLAALSLAICAVRLGASDGAGRVALAALALSWTLAHDAEIPAVLLAIGALVLASRILGIRFAPSAALVRIVWLGVAAIAVLPALFDLPDLRFFAGQFQPDFTPSVVPLIFKYLAGPLLLSVVALAAFGAPEWMSNRPALAQACTALLVGAAAYFWNDASSYDRALGPSGRQPTLQQLTPNAGEILWLHGALEPWVWLGRPSWSADVQGAASVFSRDLAITFRDRARAQIAQGLREEAMVARTSQKPKSFYPVLSSAAVSAICSRPDAPSYIVAPVSQGWAPDQALKAQLWTPPAVRVEMLFRDDGIDFPRLDRYAIVDCLRLR